MDRIVTVAQAARFLGCSPLTLQRQCRNGEIQNAVKVCGRWFINLSREWPVLFGDEK